jgi:hypothetical protein
MHFITLAAHFDGERVVLDEPVQLPPNTPLMVTVLGRNNAGDDSWSQTASMGLARAYGDDEPEYSAEDLM